MIRRTFVFGVIYGLSFFFLIVHLNFNVKTFRLTQQLQEVTLEIYETSADVDTKELNFFTQTSPEFLYEYVTNNLGMIRQDKIYVFTNQEVNVR